MGTIITLISMLIAAFNFWYYHYLVVFGRGLLEALPSDRMIAFMAAISLALRHLIFESNDKKRSWVKKKWTLPEITGAFACLTILPVNIKEDANGMLIITVIDDKAECRKEKQYVFYMDGASPEWED